MNWEIDPNDVEVGEDFADCARATVLFEIWMPARVIGRIRVSLRKLHPRGPLHRCVVEAELPQEGAYVAGVVGADPYETIQRAALAVGSIAAAGNPGPTRDLVVAGRSPTPGSVNAPGSITTAETSQRRDAA